MPYSKDIRCGAGWFEVNVNTFFDWLDDRGYEIIVSDQFCPTEVQYHNESLEEQIEEAVNKFISQKVFHETPTFDPMYDPNDYDCVWHYTFDCVKTLIQNKPTWYTLKGSSPLSTWLEEQSKLEANK